MRAFTPAQFETDLKGHEFTRAASAAKMMRALAPEGRFT
jgi:hypothetical protein